MIANGNTYCRVITPILPPEYQEVEYIENSGTQYIDTNFYPNYNNGFEIIIEYSPTNLNTRGCLLSNYDASRHISLEINAAGQQRLYYWDSRVDRTNNNVLTTKNIGVFKYYNGTFYNILNNVSREDNYNANGSCDYSLYMFVDKNKRFGTFTNYLKIYKCSIKDNNTLVRNFIPCYRKSDNEIGMYDTVNKVFYTNQGTGTFLKGNNVVHTIRYKIPTEERPYISGHVTDGSLTFTFKVNNADVTVPVDANGNWKWVQDRTITSLKDAFKDKTQLDNLTLEKCILDNCESYYNVVRNTKIVRFKLTDKQTRKAKDMTYAVYGISTLEELDLSECTLASVTQAGAMCFNLTKTTKLDLHSATFEKCGNLSYFIADSNYEEVDISNATIKSTCNVNHFARSVTKLKTIILKSKGLFTSLSFPNSKLLTEQSVVNLINAAAANVTYTLHSTVYNKCASGGEWYTDIQAAIDAKAQQGYTVTLISA